MNLSNGFSKRRKKLMCVKLAPGALEELTDPILKLKRFIKFQKKLLEQDKQQLEAEHKSAMAERAKLPVLHQPMDASYWMRRRREISAKEQALEEAEAELRELERGQV